MIKNQGKVPKKLKFNKKYIILCAIILVFVIAAILFQGITNLILPTSTQVANSLSTPQFSLYLISVNSSQTKLSMSGIVGDYMQNNAGAYIWQIDENFNIIYGCYEKENDALLIQKSLKQGGQDSQIIKIDFASLNFNGDYDAQSKKVLAKTLKIFYTTYLDLFDISASLDTNVYNDISARLAINNCYSNFNSTLADFKTLFDEIEVLNNLKNALQNGLTTLENLCAGKLINSGQTYSSLIKYRYIEFVHDYYDFLQNMAN